MVILLTSDATLRVQPKYSSLAMTEGLLNLLPSRNPHGRCIFPFPFFSSCALCLVPLSVSSIHHLSFPRHIFCTPCHTHTVFLSVIRNCSTLQQSKKEDQQRFYYWYSLAELSRCRCGSAHALLLLLLALVRNGALKAGAHLLCGVAYYRAQSCTHDLLCHQHVCDITQL